MKRIFYILSFLVFTSCMLSSCLKDSVVDTSPECYITSFSIGDIKTDVVVKRTNGSDTIITKTIGGSSIRFNIDHVKGIISSVDSVPNWANISKIVPSFSVVGTLFRLENNDSLLYVMTSGSDSINFEKPVSTMVLANDNISRKYYKIYLNKSANDLDTIVWNKGKINIEVKDDFKILVKDGRATMFMKDGNGGMKVSSSLLSSDLTSWSDAIKVEGCEIDYSSVLIYNNNFYALGSDNCIYKAEDKRPEIWNKVCDDKFIRLVAADNYYIYTFDGKNILGTNNFKSWVESGNTDMNMLPTHCIQSFAYTSKTNSNIQTVVMSGMADNKAVAWSKISAQDNDINQKWMYIESNNSNKYRMPAFKDISMTLYNGKLYAIGNEDNSYKYIYISEDNGISWHPQKTKYPVPADINTVNDKADLFSADGKLWIIQKGGNVWSGVVR